MLHFHAVGRPKEVVGRRLGQVQATLRSETRERGNKQNGFEMPQEKPQNLQDTFLNHVRKQKIPVTVFLVNGVKLQGIITWFDNFCVLLRRDGLSQLVYKHAISTIMPGTPVTLFDDESGAGET
jgi:host factor-I protein